MKITTKREAWKAVKESGWALKDVSEKLITPELCIKAVQTTALVLGYIPKKLRTPELCLEAVKQNGGAILHVPKALKTPELCLEAVKNVGWALRYVPKALKTPELCLEAVQVKHIPELLRTIVFGFEMVTSVGFTIDSSEKFKKEFMKEVKNPGDCFEDEKGENIIPAIKYIPKALRTLEICVISVIKNEHSLKYVPASKKIKNQLKEMVAQAKAALEAKEKQKEKSK